MLIPFLHSPTHKVENRLLEIRTERHLFTTMVKTMSVLQKFAIIFHLSKTTES
jgi:hypothetical protein